MMYLQFIAHLFSQEDLKQTFEGNKDITDKIKNDKIAQLIYREDDYNFIRSSFLWNS